MYVYIFHKCMTYKSSITVESSLGMYLDTKKTIAQISGRFMFSPPWKACYLSCGNCCQMTWPGEIGTQCMSKDTDPSSLITTFLCTGPVHFGVEHFLTIKHSEREDTSQEVGSFEIIESLTSSKKDPFWSTIPLKMLISDTMKDDEVVALLLCKVFEACDSLVERFFFRGVDDRKTPYKLITKKKKKDL